MRDKITKRQKNERYEYLRTKMAEMESSDDKVVLYLKWLSLSSDKREEIKLSWKKYYEDLKNTRAYKRYFEMREPFMRGDMSTIKDLAKEAKEQLDSQSWELKKPSTEDPDVIFSSQSVRRYYQLKSEKEQMDNESRGLEYYAAKEVFG